MGRAETTVMKKGIRATRSARTKSGPGESNGEHDAELANIQAPESTKL
jgi:hypothetical protein